MIDGLTTSISSDELSTYTQQQINHFFPDGCEIEKRVLDELQREVFPKLILCFSHVDNKYFRNDGEIIFNHLNSDQYSMFLYMMSFAANDLYDDSNLASKLYLLNKTLHGIDAFYEVKLPDIFLFVHPVGTVLGRASYGDYFAVYQGCGVGSNHGDSPVLAPYVTLHPNSYILGNSQVGSNCAIATGALVLDSVVAENTTYIGRPGAQRVLPNKQVSHFWIR